MAIVSAYPVVMLVRERPIVVGILVDVAVSGRACLTCVLLPGSCGSPGSPAGPRGFHRQSRQCHDEYPGRPAVGESPPRPGGLGALLDVHDGSSLMDPPRPADLYRLVRKAGHFDLQDLDIGALINRAAGTLTVESTTSTLESLACREEQETCARTGPSELRASVYRQSRVIPQGQIHVFAKTGAFRRIAKLGRVECR